MTYNELKEEIQAYDSFYQEYEKLSRSTRQTEQMQEKLCFLSGELFEITTSLIHSLTDTKDNYNIVTQLLEEMYPNSFSIMIANLDSNPKKYTCLKDLCEEINFFNEDKHYFPTDCIRFISLY